MQDIIQILLHIATILGSQIKLEQNHNNNPIVDITHHPNWNLINHYTCGESVSSRIIGGKTASLGQYPWLVRLGHLSMTAPEISFRCGGSLINPLYVLTAAHCTIRRTRPINVVRIGENNILKEIDCEEDMCAPPVQDILVEELIIHGAYNKHNENENDISLIRLQRPAQIHDFVRTICLPYGPLLTKDYMGKKLETAGWGINNVLYHTRSTELSYVRLPIVESKRCANHFRRTITKKQLCAGGIVGRDSCQGDSGGPLMVAEKVKGPPKYFIKGVVSFGDRHCGSKFPAVYTNVASYMLWILNNIKP